MITLCAMSIAGNSISSMKKTLNYDWVCHACAHENKANQPRCYYCGCAAVASIKEIEARRSGKRKGEAEQDQIDRYQIILGVCGAILGIFLKFFLWS